MKGKLCRTSLIMVAFTFSILFWKHNEKTIFYADTKEQYSITAIDEYLGKEIYSKSFDVTVTTVLYKSVLDKYVYNMDEFQEDGYTYRFIGWYDREGNNIFKRRNYIIIDNDIKVYAIYQRERDKNE